MTANTLEAKMSTQNDNHVTMTICYICNFENMFTADQIHDFKFSGDYLHLVTFLGTCSLLIL